MLYLKRKLGEEIVINGSIRVQLVEIKGSSVKIGLTFPETASVFRGEVYEKIAQQNKDSMSLDLSDLERRRKV